MSNETSEVIEYTGPNGRTVECRVIYAEETGTTLRNVETGETRDLLLGTGVLPMRARPLRPRRPTGFHEWIARCSRVGNFAVSHVTVPLPPFIPPGVRRSQGGLKFACFRPNASGRSGFPRAAAVHRKRHTP